MEFRKADPKDALYEGPKSIVLEHREGEYLHFVSSDGEFEWTATCDGEVWYQDAGDYGEYKPRDIQRYVEGAGGYRVVSHGFLAPGKIMPAELPLPEVGEHIWLQRGRAEGPVDAREFYVGTVTNYVNDTDSGALYIVTDDPEDFGTWWQNDYLPEHYVRVVAWGLAEKGWRVGDVLPPYTRLDRVWLGGLAKGTGVEIFDVGEWSSLSREILWIEED